MVCINLQLEGIQEELGNRGCVDNPLRELSYKGEQRNGETVAGMNIVMGGFSVCFLS